MKHEARLSKFAWKFGTQNLVATCTLTLRQHLEYCPKVHFGQIVYHFHQTIYHFEALEVRNPILQTMFKSELKRGSCVHLKKTGQRGKQSSKLITWVWNGFWPFKTQRNARKVLVEAKFKSYYLFQAKDTHFKPKKVRLFAWAVGEFKIPCNFELICWFF